MLVPKDPFEFQVKTYDCRLFCFI